MSSQTDDFGFIPLEQEDDFGFVPLESSAKKIPNKEPTTLESFEGLGSEFDKDIERHQARNTSRALEGIFGLPGDVASFVTGLFGKEQGILPTSQRLKEFSESATGGYTAPKNELEQAGDELFRDIGSMLTPGAGTYNIARNIGIPIVGTLAKEGLKYSGVEDRNASYAKMGTMVILDLLAHRTPGGAKQHSLDLFKEAESLVPEGALANGKILDKSLSNLETSLKAGGKRPSTIDALDKIKELRREIQKGEGAIPVKNLIEFRKSINEIVEGFGGYDIKLPTKIKNRAIGNLQDVKGKVIKATEEYGQLKNPEFAKLNRAANESYAAYENSNKIAKFIEKTVGKHVKSNAAKTLLGLAGTGVTGAATYLSPTAAVLGGSAGLAGTGAYHSFKVLHRMKNSPTLRQYYKNILEGSLKGNAGQVSANTKALDNLLMLEENQ